MKTACTLPRRSFCSLSDFKQYVQGEEELIVDATEMRTQRPAAPQKQQQRYSGKKKRIRSNPCA